MIGKWLKSRKVKLLITAIILSMNICWYLPIGGYESGAQSASDVHPLLCIFLSDALLAALVGYIYFSIKDV